MDTSGNIKRFDSILQAEAEGFRTKLSEAEAEQLLTLPAEERHAALASLRYRNYAKRDRAEARDKQSPNNGTLVWNSAAGTFNQGRNTARKALRERAKAERTKRRRERRAA